MRRRRSVGMYASADEEEEEVVDCVCCWGSVWVVFEE